MTRTEVLALAARVLGARSYLEIGVGDPRENFDRIDVPVKLGVDPAVDDARVARTTSDDFFARLEASRRFDLVFVDGDHRREQVERDLANALARLAPGGLVVLHDVDPPAAELATPSPPPAPEAPWCGEAWKVFVAARARPDLRAAVVACDCGVGLVVPGADDAPLALPGPAADLPFAWLAADPDRVLARLPPEETAIRRFLRRASVVLYTAETAPARVLDACFARLRESARGHELVVACQRAGERFAPADVVVELGERPLHHRSLYEQALAGLETARRDTAFLAEHDVLYPPGYFDEPVANRYRVTYNDHAFWLTPAGFLPVDALLLSNAAGDRALLAHAVRQRLRRIDAGHEIAWAELGIGGQDDFAAVTRRHPLPTVDVRHGGNFTGGRDGARPLAEIPFWGAHRPLAESLGVVDG